MRLCFVGLFFVGIRSHFRAHVQTHPATGAVRRSIGDVRFAPRTLFHRKDFSHNREKGKGFKRILWEIVNGKKALRPFLQPTFEDIGVFCETINDISFLLGVNRSNDFFFEHRFDDPPDIGFGDFEG